MTLVPVRRPWFSSQLSDQLLWIGGLICGIFVFVAFTAPLGQAFGWIPNPQDFLDFPIHAPPSAQHWFGTNRQGYDVFSRTLFGTQAALQVVVVATLFSLILGVPLGLLSGYRGGWLDRALLFLMDTVYTLPGLLLAVTVAFVVGKGVVNAAVALSVAYIPQYYRVVRNHTVSLKNEVFIEAARAMGASTPRILRRYLLINVLPSIPVLFTLNAADAILTLAGLGFLGLGLPPEVPEWGQDLRQALDGLSVGIWWTTLFPGLAMTTLVVGLSLLGEGLGERLDPRRLR
ncbi:ABC transporter permease [Parathermosynechococcus lividus]